MIKLQFKLPQALISRGFTRRTVFHAPAFQQKATNINFYERKQHDGESLNDFMAGLRKLSEHCKFGTLLEHALRDKFVCGLTSTTIRKKLLTVKELAFQKALEISCAMKEAEKQAKLITNEFSQLNRVTQNVGDLRKYKDFFCNKCNNLERACREIKVKSRTNQVVMEKHLEGELSSSEDESHVQHLHHMISKNIFKIQLSINEKPFEFETITSFFLGENGFPK